MKAQISFSQCRMAAFESSADFKRIQREEAPTTAVEEVATASVEGAVEGEVEESAEETQAPRAHVCYVVLTTIG
eukprot:gene3104-biopygen3348